MVIFISFIKVLDNFSVGSHFSKKVGCCWKFFFYSRVRQLTVCNLIACGVRKSHKENISSLVLKDRPLKIPLHLRKYLHCKSLEGT